MTTNHCDRTVSECGAAREEVKHFLNQHLSDTLSNITDKFAALSINFRYPTFGELFTHSLTENKKTANTLLQNKFRRQDMKQRLVALKKNCVNAIDLIDKIDDIVERLK